MNTTTTQLDAVIVGLGRAGLGLHVPILQKIKRNGVFGRIVGMVDGDEDRLKTAQRRCEDEFHLDTQGTQFVRSLGDLKNINTASTIIHVCTPSIDHKRTLAAASELGYRRIIVEKPCAHNTVEVDEMKVLAQSRQLEVVVVNPYIYSRTVAHIRELIASRDHPPHYLEFELSKPRKHPTLVGRSAADSAFDVELPHQIATALHLIQPRHYRLLRAECRHMHYREKSTDVCDIVQNMGLGYVVLELDTCIAVLPSYLDAPTRTRVLKLRFPEGDHVVAMLPVTEDDHTTELNEYGPPNADGYSDVTRTTKLPDDLFTSCLADSYARYAKGESHPSNLDFNRAVIEIMDKAKQYTRTRQ